MSASKSLAFNLLLCLIEKSIDRSLCSYWTGDWNISHQFEFVMFQNIISDAGCYFKLTYPRAYKTLGYPNKGNQNNITDFSPLKYCKHKAKHVNDEKEFPFALTMICRLLFYWSVPTTAYILTWQVSSLYKVDNSLRWTPGAGPKGVHFRDSGLYMSFIRGALIYSALKSHRPLTLRNMHWPILNPKMYVLFVSLFRIQ